MKHLGLWGFLSASIIWPLTLQTLSDNFWNLKKEIKDTRFLVELLIQRARSSHTCLQSQTLRGWDRSVSSLMLCKFDAK